MSFLSLIIVFLLEQLRPLQYQRLIAAPLRALADFVESHINAGSYRHGVIAWMILVLPFVLLALALHFLLYRVNPLLALLFNVLVLYLTMGFRQFSHHYSDIQQALGEGDLERARSLLSEWRGSSCEKMGSADISRLSIELALAASHRHVFAVLLWFVILPGPCGAVLYRLSATLADYWRERPAAGNSDFVRFSRQVFAIIDWFPVRATSFQSPVCQIRVLVTHSLLKATARRKLPLREKRSLPRNSQGKVKLVTARRAFQSQIVSFPKVLPAASQRPSGDRATPQWLLPNVGRFSVIRTDRASQSASEP